MYRYQRDDDGKPVTVRHIYARYRWYSRLSNLIAAALCVGNVRRVGYRLAR